jgi:hypothetical protein
VLSDRRFYGPWLILACTGVLFIILLFPGASSSSAGARFQAGDPQPGVPQAAVSPADSAPTAVLQPSAVAGPHTVWLPLISLNYPPPPLSHRLGYGVTWSGSLSQYPGAATLKAGWYVNWAVEQTPQRPNGMEFVQMVRLHQNITCPLWSQNAWDRTKCPYVTPPSYTFEPSANEITQAARANPGSLWLIGNEMDRRDWQGGGQDEMMPDLYATAYHELYTLIKGADPTARLAIGGVIQATPLRLEYLTKVWNAYQGQFGTPMPVDVWNVHNFIFKEDINSYGASIPPGSTATTGMLYTNAQHVSMDKFDLQIRAFRDWMKARGQQEKPLIVSEYGVIYPFGEFNQATVQDFMIKTFDYFLKNPQSQDCSLGYVADNCRLVQRWAWYSFNDDGNVTTFNRYANLFSPQTFQITSTGIRFREYSLTNIDALGH